MNDCNLCKYIISEYDSNKQTCSKWVNKDNFDIPCNSDFSTSLRLNIL